MDTFARGLKSAAAIRADALGRIGEESLCILGQRHWSGHRSGEGGFHLARENTH
jgi:hypothetical protein